MFEGKNACKREHGGAMEGQVYNYTYRNILPENLFIAALLHN